MNRIHPTAIISDDVRLGDENVIGPYSVIVGQCDIGNQNWIGPHVVIGTPAEMRGSDHSVGWDSDPGTGRVSIGDRNVVREFTVIQQSTTRVTLVGDDCYFMDKVHIAHDCEVGNAVTISCAVMFAGHVIIGDRCNIGLGAVVHQRTVIGEGSMIGMSSVVTRHIEPYALAYGSPARVRGANSTGLERSGFDQADIEAIDSAHKDATGLPELIGDPYRCFEEHLRRVAEQF